MNKEMITAIFQVGRTLLDIAEALVTEKLSATKQVEIPMVVAAEYAEEGKLVAVTVTGTAVPSKKEKTEEEKAAMNANLAKAREATAAKRAKAVTTPEVTTPAEATPVIIVEEVVAPPVVIPRKRSPKKVGTPQGHLFILSAFEKGPKPLYEIKKIAEDMFLAEGILPKFEELWSEFISKDNFTPNGYSYSKTMEGSVAVFAAVNNNKKDEPFFA